MRRLPLAGLPSSGGGAEELLELVVLLDPHAARNDGPRASAAAAAAPPPRSRRRDVRVDAIRDSCRGSNSFAMGCLSGVREVFGGKGIRRAWTSGLEGSVEHLFEVFGG